MSNRLWQVVILGIVLYSIVNFAFTVPQVTSGGATFGISAGSSVRTGVIDVSAVKSGGPAARAGIRKGDHLTFVPSFDALIALSNTSVGDRITVRDAGRTIELTAVPDDQPFPAALFISFLLAKLAFLTMAALIILRRPADPAARSLSLFLASFGSAIIVFTAFPAFAVRWALLLISQMMLMVGALAFYAFTALFPTVGQRGFRLWIRRSLPWVSVAGVLVAAGTLVSAFFVNVSSAAADRIFSLGYLGLYLLIVAAALISLAISFKDSAPDQRARLRWTIAIFFTGFSGIVALFIAYFFGNNTQSAQFFALTIIVIPFGLAYVILKHRMFDIGFVVNRAVVYALVSIIVVGVFIVFEWLLSHIVEQNSRASVALQLGGALALGLSIRYLHGRVDRYVDDLFFRDRHLAEQAIRKFAHEAALISDAEILVQRTVEVAQRNARLEAAAFYARRDGGYVALHSTFGAGASFDENDEAILEMRAWHQPVHLHDLHATALPGENAFPMLVRGTLAGFLLCGGKLSHESLAPDERDALRVLARDAGIALDSLRIARIEAELAFLSADGKLPEALRLRLSSLADPQDGSQPAGPPVRFSQ